MQLALLQGGCILVMRAMVKADHLAKRLHRPFQLSLAPLGPGHLARRPLELGLAQLAPRHQAKRITRPFQLALCPWGRGHLAKPHQRTHGYWLSTPGFCWRPPLPSAFAHAHEKLGSAPKTEGVPQKFDIPVTSNFALIAVTLSWHRLCEILQFGDRLMVMRFLAR